METRQLFPATPDGPRQPGAYDAFFPSPRTGANSFGSQPQVLPRFPTTSPYHVPQLGVPDSILKYREELRDRMEAEKTQSRSIFMSSSGAPAKVEPSRLQSDPSVTDAINGSGGGPSDITSYPPYTQPPPTPAKDAFSPMHQFDSLGNIRRSPRIIAVPPEPNRAFAPLSPYARVSLEDDDSAEGLANARRRAQTMTQMKEVFGRGSSSGPTATPRFVPFAVRKLGHDEVKWTDPNDVSMLSAARARQLRKWDVTTAEVVEAQVTIPNRNKDYTLEYLMKRRIVAYDDDEGFTFHARPMVGTVDGLRYVSGDSTRVFKTEVPEGTSPLEVEQQQCQELLVNVNTSIAADASDVVCIGNHVFVISRDRQRAMRFNPNNPSKLTGTLSGVWDTVERACTLGERQGFGCTEEE